MLAWVSALTHGGEIYTFEVSVSHYMAIHPQLSIARGVYTCAGFELGSGGVVLVCAFSR